MPLKLNTPIEQIHKLLKPQVAALKKLEIFTLQDLLLYFPYRYLDFSLVKPIAKITAEEMVSVKGKIKTINSRFSFRGRMSLCEAIIADETGNIKVIWFNQPYLAKVLQPNEEIFLAGTPEIYNHTLQLVNPIYEKATDFPIHTARLLPLYHLTAGIYHKTLRNLIAKAFPAKEQLVDILPNELLTNQNLPNIQTTIQLTHFPESIADVERAKTRLAFEEIFLNQLAVQKHKLELVQKSSIKISFDQALVKNFVDSLPFKLTLEQKKATWEILQDLEKSTPMNRLLEGDVGSGKTLVALICALECMSQGLQVVLVVPTEILAKQHHLTALKFFHPKPNLNTRVILFTQNFIKINEKDAVKKDLLEELSLGMPGLYIGTHALLQENIKFKNLALVIIDEQHRFGVNQRAYLVKNHNKIPHLLSLSATPIPRSLQLAVYGDLSISQIKHKPLGRKSIITKLVDTTNRIKTYAFIKQQIMQGRQIFVITPLIEESDQLGIKSAKLEQENLNKIFPEFKVGLLHGKLKGKEKETVMQDFSENKTQILVSTSVVEVGVDVPNATVMVIEGAEKFGLAQLHQFRGRVGRSEHQSYCFLFATNRYSPSPNPSPQMRGISGVPSSFVGRVREGGDNKTQTRLEAFTQTQDGFALAELDLKHRGFGDLYGQNQSGWNYKYFDESYTSLIPKAKTEALKLLKTDLNLEKHPLLKNKIQDKIIHLE
jgi:ATP-dependent DNA helicase RecG